ncbi:MAG: tetratricopeptide repeat protein [Acidobacteria bacterium]|nr:tetratricopeptide repeat protein [Acidobacteriota bacterium]MDW7984728.1 tetratricopeptide repeat protein [Acidobacteriota bacterium]
MGRKHLTRKQIKHYEEPTFKFLRLILTGWQTHPGWWWMTLALAIGVAFTWVVWNRRIERQAQPLIDRTIQAAQDLLNDPPADPKVYQERLQAVTKDLERLLRELGDSRLQTYGAYYLGSLYLQMDRMAEAHRLFESVRSAPEPIGSLAQLGYAQSLAGLNRYGEALEELRQLEQKKPRAVYDDFLLYLRARWLLAQGQRDAARQTLEQLLQKYGESPLTAEAQRLLGRLTLAAETAS